MTAKRFTIDKEYDTDGNWEYCYVDNDTGRTFNFADDFCDTDFIELVNAIIDSLNDENEQLKNICKNLIHEVNKRGITVTMPYNCKELLE